VAETTFELRKNEYTMEMTLGNPPSKHDVGELITVQKFALRKKIKCSFYN